MMADPIADMLTRLRNAGSARHDSFVVPGSRLKKHILELLLEEGYIRGFEKADPESKFEDYKVFLKYDAGKKHIIKSIEKVSKPGRRVYIKADEIRPFRNNIGTMIISTSKGIVTGKTARKLKVGGEVLCTVS